MTQLLLSRPVISFVLFVERWILSALFLFLAFQYLQTLQLLVLMSKCADLLPPSLIARDGGLSDGVHFQDYARYSLLVASNLVSGILLLISRKPTRRPTRAREIVIPLIATFSYMGFNQRVPLPAWMTTPLVPVQLEGPLAAVGICLSFVGACLALAAVLWLGRSLGIVASVREIVLTGPYRWVRHPVYLGYIIILTGLFFTACTVRMTVLVIGATILLIWRARIEEALLIEHSPEYRDWMGTGAWGWFRRAGAVQESPSLSHARAKIAGSGQREPVAL